MHEFYNLVRNQKFLKLYLKYLCSSWDGFFTQIVYIPRGFLDIAATMHFPRYASLSNSGNYFYNWYSERSFNFYISTFCTLKYTYTVEQGVNIRARRIKSKSKICITVQINSASNSISNFIDYSCNQYSVSLLLIFQSFQEKSSFFTEFNHNYIL